MDGQVALDRSTSTTGCLQIAHGSHLPGRIDHVPAPGEDRRRPVPIRHILERLAVVPCEPESGVAVFFHANTPHRSDQSRSPHRRWTLTCRYKCRMRR